jgi:hypothetical protein
MSSPRPSVLYVGVSQNLHARLCPGSNHYDCYTNTPFNRGGNIRLLSRRKTASGLSIFSFSASSTVAREDTLRAAIKVWAVALGR